MKKDWFHYDPSAQLITLLTNAGEVLEIRLADLEISYFSSGHGGQNVNRHMNGVRLIYNIPQEFRLSFQKTRQLITRSISQRSREQNLKQALDQMSEKIKWYFYVPTYRKPTKIPKLSKEKRLQSKARRGKLKQDRRKFDYRPE